MKIAFDISALDPHFKEHAQRGIGRYVRELKRYFDSAQLASKISYFQHRDLGRGIYKFASRAVDYLPLARATIRQQVLLPRQFRAMSQDSLIHFPAHMDVPARSMPPYMVTVLDLIPQVLSDLYRANKPDWRFRLARHLENEAIRNASLLLCISQNTADDVHRILGVPKERLRVTPLGVDEKFFDPPSQFTREEVLHRWSLPTDAPILVYVGGIDPRKNWNFALQVLKQLKEKAQSSARPNPVLVFVGRIDRDHEFPRLKSLVSQLDLTNEVRMPGFIPDEDLLKLFACSTALFFPSLYEGFGLPPLEAMAAGLPVVSSNTSCLPQVVGDGGLLIDPHDVREAVEALDSLCSKTIDRGALVERGRRQARNFTWDKTGALTLACYDEALRQRSAHT